MSKKFKCKPKIVEVEITVPDFEECNFVTGRCYPDKDKHNVSVFAQVQGSDSIEAKSDPFIFDEKTVIIHHCSKAYYNLLKNVKKFVEVNQ